MNRICAVQVVSPVTQGILSPSLRSVFGSKVTSATQCAKQLHIQTIGRFCVQHCGIRLGAICFIKCDFSAHSKSPKRSKKNLLPFEIEPEKDQDILLYKYYDRDRYYKHFSSGGLFIGFFILSGIDLVLGYLKRAAAYQKSTDEKEEIPWYAWWRKVNLESIAVYAKYPLIVVALVYAAIFLYYPTRMVREITLLKGGQKIIFETHQPFGRTKRMELPLSDVSGRWESEEEPYLSVKLKGSRVPYLIDSDGQIPEPKLFDYTIGQHRF